MPLGYYRGGSSDVSLLRTRQPQAEHLSREKAAESALDRECEHMTTFLDILNSAGHRSTLATGMEGQAQSVTNVLGTAGLTGKRVNHGKEIWPVYRTSPYRAEAERLAGGSSIAQILFVDEGQQCRCSIPAQYPEPINHLPPLTVSSDQWL